jgi:uncharacterized protein
MVNNILIKRALLPELTKHLDKQEITLLVGPRQAGKTTLLHILENECKSRGIATLFLSLDSEENKNHVVSQEALINRLRLQFGTERGYVFLDEIQRKDNAGLFLKGIYDMGLPYKFIVSGSGSMDLKAKMRESLAGRKLVFEVYPLSFYEFSDFQTEYQYSDKLPDFFLIDTTRYSRLLTEYLDFGGYPRVVLEQTLAGKHRVIDEIYQSYIEKDISALLRIERLDAFRDIVKILAGQQGQPFSYLELSSTVGISYETVRNYLWYLEETFVMERVTPFFRNTRKEIIKSPTMYFTDLGLRNYSAGVFGREHITRDKGFAFQNMVYLMLRQMTLHTSMHIHSWRTKDGAEVDFVIDTSASPLAIEVKYSSFRTPVIGKSLRSFIKRYNPPRAYVVTKDYSHEIKVDATIVHFVPVYAMSDILPKLF